MHVKYTLLLTLVSGTISLIMIFVMAWFIQRNYTLFLGDELGISARVIEIVRHEQQMLEQTLFIMFLISIIVMFLAAFYTVSKLVGPVNALKRQLSQYSKGNFSHDFRLAKDDEFRELEPLVNNLRRMVNGLTQKTAE